MDIQLFNKPQLISNNSLHENLSQNFDMTATRETELLVSSENIFNEIVEIFIKVDYDRVKQAILDYFNNYNITLQEIYDLLINNQDNSNAVVILGEFNYF